MSWIFLKTGRLPSEILALPVGERAIIIAGTRLAMQAESQVPLAYVPK